MKICREDLEKACGCRSAGECNHNSFVEIEALEELVDRFADDMKKKLRKSLAEKGMSGWDDPNWHPEEIRLAMFDHVAKGDPVDVANFAAFLWNRNI